MRARARVAGSFEVSHTVVEFKGPSTQSGNEYAKPTLDTIARVETASSFMLMLENGLKRELTGFQGVLTFNHSTGTREYD